MTDNNTAPVVSDAQRQKVEDFSKRPTFDRLPDGKRCCTCYKASHKSRAIPIFNVCNFAIIVLGVIILLVGLIQSGEIHAPEKVYEMIPMGFDVSQKSMGVGMILLGIFCVVLALIGFLQAKCAGMMTTLGYITFAGLFATILIIIGMVLGGFAGDTMFLEIRSGLCSQATTIKEQYGRAVNAQMCSTQCPCDGSDADTVAMWQGYTTAAEDQSELAAYEKLNTLAYYGRQVNSTANYPRYGSSHWYGRTGSWKKKVALDFRRDGFTRTKAENEGAIGDFVAFDNDCDCLDGDDLPPTVFTNARVLADYGTGLDGKCGTIGNTNSGKPFCFVKETCRGANGSGFKVANGTAVNSGKSTVAVAGKGIYWAQCDNVGDTSALVAEPKPVYTNLQDCYTKPNAYTKTLTEQLGTLSVSDTGDKFPSNVGTGYFLNARPYQWGTNFRNYVRKFITSNGMEILSELEDKYDCASVCEVPLFYITKDISEGRPTQECAAGIYHSMKGSYKAEAAFSIICSLCLWVAMTCALIIACGPNLDDPEDNAAPRSEAYKADDPKPTIELPPVAINDDEKVGLPEVPPVENKVE